MRKRHGVRPILLLGVVMVLMVLVSGCAALDNVDKFSCEFRGNIWMEGWGECCPKECPGEPLENPTSPSDHAIVDKCRVCWLP